MRETATIRMERFRYGHSALWTIHDHISGSGSRRLSELVNLFFQEGGIRLLLDLREAGFIDDAGAAALTTSCAAHPSCSLVGLPPAWEDFAQEVRTALLKLEPASDLAAALTRAEDPAAQVNPEQRSHARIPVQFPIGVCFEGRAAIVSLRDISRGGLRFDGLPADWMADLDFTDPASQLEVFGLEVDPLGGEITGRSAGRAMPAIPVHCFAGVGIGARFLKSHPPV